MSSLALRVRGQAFAGMRDVAPTIMAYVEPRAGLPSALCHIYKLRIDFHCLFEPIRDHLESVFDWHTFLQIVIEQLPFLRSLSIECRDQLKQLKREDLHTLHSDILAQRDVPVDIPDIRPVPLKINYQYVSRCMNGKVKHAVKTITVDNLVH